MAPCDRANHKRTQPHIASFRNEWLRDLRPCHPDLFERYFRFSLPAEDISESDLNSLISVVGDKNSFVRKMLEFDQRQLLGTVVFRLQARDFSIPPKSAIPFVAGMLDVEKELLTQPRASGVAVVPAHMQAVLLIESILRQEPTDARAFTLSQALMQSKALFLPMVILGLPDQRREEPLEPTISVEAAASLRDLCVERIEAAASRGELLSHPMFRPILGFWSRLRFPEASAWFGRTSKSDSGLLLLLKVFIDAMNEIEGDRVVEVRYRFALEEFAKFAEPESVEKRIRSLSATRGGDQITFRLVLRAFDRWKSSGVLPFPTDPDAWTS
jgi:hypothetical protein